MINEPARHVPSSPRFILNEPTLHFQRQFYKGREVYMYIIIVDVVWYNALLNSKLCLLFVV